MIGKTREIMTSYKIGELAAKYETSNKGPGYISNGSAWGDPGGDSYGSYQLESKLGTLQSYLNSGDAYTKQLKGLLINSRDFKKKWVEIAIQDPEGFQQSQFDFLCNKPGGYNDAYRFACAMGWASESFALQSAMFSISNQSGRWKTRIFTPSGIDVSDSVVEQINKLYDARAAYFKVIKLPEKVRKSILQSRTIDERKDCLKLAAEKG